MNLFRKHRINAPSDESCKKSHPIDAIEIAEDQHDQDIINIIQQATSGVVADEELYAKQITAKKKSRFDFIGETRRVDVEVKKNQKLAQAKYVYPSTKLLEPAVDTANLITQINDSMISDDSTLKDSKSDLTIDAPLNNMCSERIEESKSKYSIEYIDNYMSGREFEVFTKELLENNGFSNVIVTPSSNDFGVDVIAVDQHGIKFSIQCKKYQGKVDNKAIQEVFTSKAVHNCHVAAVLTNSYFTQNAIQLANINNVLLWDRSVLLEMIKSIDNTDNHDSDNHVTDEIIAYDESDSAFIEMQNNATKLIETLNSFGVKANIVNICRGPLFTRYELQPAPGVKKSRIIDLFEDIEFNLGANGVHIEPSIPGKAAIGIDVPNKVASIVTLRELIETDEFKKSKSKLNCVLGRDISGEIITTDLAKMPHLLIAGTTGSGKSVCVNALLMSILFKATPDEVKLLLVDPKMVEFSKYKGIPHLLVPVISDAKKAADALNWAVSEMLQRYRIFSEYDCKGIDSFNELVDKNLAYIEEQKQKSDYDPEAEEQPCMEIDGLKVPTEHMCRIVIVIDELADLMMAAPSEVEESICQLAQMARQAGIYMVVATNHITPSVLTNRIKEGFPSRIALKVNSRNDSRTILDTDGAEKLIGRGDLLYAPVGVPKPIRVQCCFTRDDEIDRVTAFLKKSHTAEYNKEIEDKIRKIAAEELNGSKGKDAAVSPGNAPEVDSMMEEAIKFVIESGQISTYILQRRLKVGYARAGRMIDDMEQMGIVGPHQGSKKRDVLITYNEWLERNNMLGSPDEDGEGEDAPADEDDPW